MPDDRELFLRRGGGFMLKEMLHENEPTGRYLRRNERLRHEDIHPLSRMIEMQKMGWSNREMYEAGRQDGESVKPMNLTDVLFCMSELGLGKAKVIQESNSHVIIHVYQCLCCRHPYSDRDGCVYVAGFISGAFHAMGKSNQTVVREMNCGGAADRPCVFVASW